MTPELRALWLAERKTGIGSSDAPALCAVCPESWERGTPLAVYMDKTGQLPEQPPSPYMRWGTLLEDAIATAYQEDTGRTLVQGHLVRHPEMPWMLATPDRLAEADDRPVELKTCHAFAADDWGEPGTDQIPDYYLVQVQHQMAVLGADKCDVAVLIGGNDFRVYTVERSTAFIDVLLRVEVDFWKCVEERRPPLPNYSHPATPELLDVLHAPRGETIQLFDADTLDLAKRYSRLGGAISEMEKEKKRLRAELTHRMGDASIAELAEGYKVRRSPVKRNGYTVAPTEYTLFSVKCPSPEK